MKIELATMAIKSWQGEQYLIRYSGPTAFVLINPAAQNVINCFKHSPMATIILNNPIAPCVERRHGLADAALGDGAKRLFDHISHRSLIHVETGARHISQFCLISPNDAVRLVLCQSEAYLPFDGFE